MRKIFITECTGYIGSHTCVELLDAGYEVVGLYNFSNSKKEVLDKIKEIFTNNKERYDYRRITLELRNQGYNVNHKKVYRIMVKLGLKSLKETKENILLIRELLVR